MADVTCASVGQLVKSQLVTGNKLTVKQ